MTYAVYLAARFSRQDELAAYANQLRDRGVAVTSRWLTGVHDWTGVPDEQIPVEDQGRFAQDDLDDIDRADALVFFGDTPGKTGTRGGACVEFGYALGIGMPVIVVGDRQHVFGCLPCVTFCETWSDALQLLAGWTRKEAA